LGPHRGATQPSSLRILANTNWSPRVHVRGEMNPRPHAPRQHEPSDENGMAFQPSHPESSNRIHAGYPQGIAQTQSFCVMADDRPDCQRERRGINSTLDATGRSDSP